MDNDVLRFMVESIASEGNDIEPNEMLMSEATYVELLREAGISEEEINRRLEVMRSYVVR